MAGKMLHPARRLGLVAINVAANAAVLLLLLVPIIVLDWDRVSRSLAGAHAPDLATIAAADPMTLVHLFSLLLAAGLGFYLLLGKKGSRAHRALGWTWALLLTVGAASSLFLRRAEVGWSFFHGFTLLAVIVTPLALVAARKHRVRWHAALMTYLFVNVILLAGIFAVYPGFAERLLVRAFFH
ncbi:MAG TPA: hypothetical protein VF339_16975 [Gammaproteobacteria bacterium]